jgi:hypothetical protein
VSEGVADGRFGLRIPSGPDQAAILPPVNIDEVSIRFNEPMDVELADLELRGVNVASYALDPLGFSYDAATMTATWRLGAATPFFDTDNIRVILFSGGVTDDAGNQNLDGDWLDNMAVFPSGDGVAGGDFSFRFNVGAADVNGDGSTTVGT